MQDKMPDKLSYCGTTVACIKPYMDEARASGPFQDDLEVLKDLEAEAYYVVLVNGQETAALAFSGPFDSEDAAFADIKTKDEEWWTP